MIGEVVGRLNPKLTRGPKPLNLISVIATPNLRSRPYCTPPPPPQCMGLSKEGSGVDCATIIFGNHLGK